MAAKIKDIVALTKPKITLMATLVAMAGILHAQNPKMPTILMVLMGIGLLVSGSSALNMYLEKDLDKYMERTKQRPLPAGRLQAYWAVLVAFFCVFLACPLLIFAGNYLALIAGLFAFLLYVFVYTPLKTKSLWALLIGSIPGAMPVVLGYLSFSNIIDLKAITLFLWAFLWQIPHFLAISLFREKEYTKAGFPVLSHVYGISFAKISVLLTSLLLVLSTFGLYVSQVISKFGLFLGLSLGLWFLLRCYQGYRYQENSLWAKKAFMASLIYQTLLFFLLIGEAIFQHVDGRLT